MSNIEKYYMPVPLEISFQGKRGVVRSNFILKWAGKYFCVSSYHGVLAHGRTSYDVSRSPKRLNAYSHSREIGHLYMGRIDQWFDFAIVSIGNLDIWDLQEPLPIDQLSHFKTGHHVGLISTPETYMLVPSAKQHRFEHTLRATNLTLKPGDSGLLIAYNVNEELVIAGWALGNTKEGSYLLPYHRFDDYLDQIDFQNRIF